MTRLEMKNPDINREAAKLSALSSKEYLMNLLIKSKMKCKN